MIIQGEKDVEGLKRIGKIVAQCLEHMFSKIEPGMSLKELDDIGRDFLMAHGARSAPEVTYKFPGATCISINQEAAHGIPRSHISIKAGDLINIDVSAELDGYFADTGGSYCLSPINQELKKLCKATKMARDKAIENCKAGEPMNLIGKTVEKVARKYGYNIIRNLGSHGVGRKLHEEPGFIPSYFDPGEKRIFKEGMVITVEPFLTTGSDWAHDTGDGWTLINPGQHFSAQYEHTIIITKSAPIICTLA